MEAQHHFCPVSLWTEQVHLFMKHPLCSAVPTAPLSWQRLWGKAARKSRGVTDRLSPPLLRHQVALGCQHADVGGYVTVLSIAVPSKERQPGLCVALNKFPANLTAICYGSCTLNQLSCREHEPESVASQNLGYGAEGWCRNNLKSGSFLGGFQMIVLCPVGL